MTVLSGLLLVAGVLAYGVAGAKLHSGSRAEGSALRSGQWWLGTSLQAVGFLFTLVARRALPLLLVQAVTSAGLAVTAVYEHLTGVRRLSARTASLIGLVVVSLAVVATASETGPSVAIEPVHLALLVVGAVVAGALWFVRTPPLLSGAFAGWGYSVGAIGARLVMGDPAHPPWVFWQLPWQNWAAGVLTVGAIVLGQMHLTRGLSAPDAAPVLAAMYFLEVCLPAAVGLTLLGEWPRPGMAWPMALGAAVALGGTLTLAFRLQPHEEGAEAGRPHT